MSGAGRMIFLSADLVNAIERYARTNWKDGRDPSGIGALNAVAFIGERVAEIVMAPIPFPGPDETPK